MKKTLLKLSILALGLLTSVGASAKVGTSASSVFTCGTTETGITKTYNFNQDAANSDTILFGAYDLFYSTVTYAYSDECNSSSGTKTPILYNAITGSTLTNLNECYSGTSYTNARSNARKKNVRVTNCIGALVSGKDLVLSAYEITNEGGTETRATEASKTSTFSSTGSTSITGLDAAKTYDIEVIGTSTSNCEIYEIALEYPAAIPTPALKSFIINGIIGTISGVNVTINLPYGSTEPTKAEIEAACTINDVATSATYNEATGEITVTDGITNVVYALTINISATASTDATLKSLSVGGTAVKDFAADKYTYDVEVPYGTAAQPAITYEANDATAKPVLTNANWTSETKTATVKVTAQDEKTTLTYTINFTIADLKRTLTSIAFSNGVGGYIINDEAVMVTGGTPHTITVPYIGETKPTAGAATFGETETSGEMSVDGSKYSLKSILDGGTSQLDYAVTYRQLTPANIALNTVYEFSAEDASASWIHTVYGYDASKGLRYSKTTNTDKPRSTEGTTRIVFAIPAGVTKVTLNSTGTNRAIKITSSAGTVEKSAANSYEVEIDGTEASLLIVESNQTGGDGGFASIVLSDGSPVLSNECDITSFTIAGVAATISGTSITAELPAGTDVTALIPSIVTSTGATVDPTTAQDFSSAVEYTVTAEDGVTTKTYTVTITVADPATGVEEAEAEVVKTYYISADGKTYNAAVKGLPLIKVEELSNGTIKTSKILVED